MEDTIHMNKWNLNKLKLLCSERGRVVWISKEGLIKVCDIYTGCDLQVYDTVREAMEAELNYYR